PADEMLNHAFGLLSLIRRTLRCATESSRPLCSRSAFRGCIGCCAPASWAPIATTGTARKLAHKLVDNRETHETARGRVPDSSSHTKGLRTSLAQRGGRIARND